MKAAKSLAVFLLLVGPACSKPLDPPPAQLTITQRIFEPVYRASKTLQGATNAGVNMLKFSELMQAFATEIAIAKDQQMNELDKQLIGLYDEAFGALQFSAVLWKAKNEAHQEWWNGEIPVGFGAKMSPEYAPGIAKYELRPIDRKHASGVKYRALPGDSIQLMWAKAGETLAKATEVYYGRATPAVAQKDSRQ